MTQHTDLSITLFEGQIADVFLHDDYESAINQMVDATEGFYIGTMKLNAFKDWTVNESQITGLTERVFHEHDFNEVIYLITGQEIFEKFSLQWNSAIGALVFSNEYQDKKRTVFIHPTQKCEQIGSKSLRNITMLMTHQDRAAI